MPPVARNPLSLFEVTLVVSIFAGWFVLASIQAVLAGFPIPEFTDQVALEILAVESIASAIALAVLWARGWRWNDIGINVDWLHSFVGVLLFGATLVVYFVMWEVFRHVETGRDFLIQMSHATAMSLPMVILLSLVNGVFEEFFLCRYLIEAFRKFGFAFALGVSGLVRVSYHLYQGPLGAIFVLGFALVVTAFYWRYKQVWPVMFAHIIYDVFAFA